MVYANEMVKRGICNYGLQLAITVTQMLYFERPVILGLILLALFYEFGSINLFSLFNLETKIGLLIANNKICLAE